jgi:hypothetical protein
VNVIIDAHLIHAYYLETVHGRESECTGPISPVIERLGAKDNVFLDSGEHIEGEWRALVDPVWFEAWYGDLIANHHAEIIDVGNWSTLLKRLAIDFGFPSSSKDKWYIRTAKTLTDARSEDDVAIVTEDMDFHDPRKKASSAAQREADLARVLWPTRHFSAQARRYRSLVCLRPLGSVSAV